MKRFTKFDKKVEEAIEELLQYLEENSEELDPRFSKIVDEHFWDLVYKEKDDE